MLSFEVKILASRLSDAIENYPQFLKEIEELQKADPSKNLKYLDWQLKQLSQREPLDEVIEMTRVFHARGAKLKKRDIYQYKTLGELREAIEELGRSSKEKRTGDAAELFQEERSKAKAYGSVVFDNDDVLVVKPKNVEESCYFGRNARWCISATESRNYFVQYTLRDDRHFYFIINKNLPLKHIFQKVAWQGAPREKPTFWRSDDQSFKRNDADFKRWEAVTPGLEEILEVIKAHLKKNPTSHLRMRVDEGDVEGLSTEEKLYALREERSTAPRANISPKLLERLANDKDSLVQLTVAQHPDTPAALLEKLADNETFYVREAVAKHPNAPAAVLEKLARIDDDDMNLAIVKNPKAPATLLEKFADNENTKIYVAEHANTPAAVLEKLAGDKDWYVRRAVAENPNTPAAVLDNLVVEEEMGLALARNPNASAAILERLAGHEDWMVREAVAKNPASPVAILEKLAGDTGWTVRKAVAINPNTPMAVLEKLASDEDKYVNDAAAKALQKRTLSARLDAVVETTARVRLSAQARLALEEAAAVMAARLMPVEEAMRILGIDRGVLADATALKKAYRTASMKSHPDRGGSTALMQQVNEAYEVLSQHHEPSRAGGKSKAEEEAEYARDVARSLRTVQAALAKAFDPAAFTRHFANATGKEFTADVKQRVDDDYKKNPRAVNIDATWRSADGATVFSLHIYVNLADAIRVRMLGGGEDSLAFTVITRVEILHDSRKSKFQQRDWKFTSEARTLMDPEDLFPKAKIKKMIGGKEKARKFSARDMRLGMEKYLGAQIEDPWVQFPIGAPVPPIEGLSRFLQKFPNRFVVKMWRSVLMRTPIWDLYGVEGPVVPKQGRPKFQGPKHVSALESEALLDALVELQKEAEGMLDGAKLAEMAARAFEKARQKDE